MQPRERVLTALRHEEPDRVPLFYRDVPEVGERLARDLGVSCRDELLEFLGIDFRWVEPSYVGPALVDASTGYRRNIWGVAYRYVEAGHGGHWEPVEFPLATVDDIAALDDHPWPTLDWFDFSTLPEQTRRYDDYALMTAPGVASPGVLATMQDLLGMERTLLDMKLRPELFAAIVDRVLEFNLAFIERMHEAAGGQIDFFRIGEDYGTQKGLLFGLDDWRRFFRPTLIAMSGVARRFGAHYYHHSCGAVRPMIEHLVECGVEVLDPIQVKAADMVPSELKAKFGDRLCFSGGVDEQELLPTGSPADVRRSTRELLDAMAPGGGFFIGPTHNFQADIPTANVAAMYQAARGWRY